ncbi:hypothetical protein FOYG_04875 [Fusarium oxysporum NRRL 32931]|uniref:Uncharacterized protein n=1 Tax=Fusarium oxysporum NRRL 32931 TaxID=660029 RepID=W9IM65_FUSOX|nr:hypothetical protein FOYG_04875 [Fusarium oxysporum NRRL 32931]
MPTTPLTPARTSVTGRVENKKNKTKAQNRQAEKLADKTTDKQLKFGIS